MLNLIIFGPPGAGKGTQSKYIVDQFELIHLSTGDIFRYNMGNNTELGKLAKSYIDKGQLVPDEVTIKMLEEEVGKYEHPNGFIFDGFPRTIPQAEALEKFLNSKGEAITGVVSLEVSEDELKERLRKRAIDSGRTDDADPAIIANRIEVYKNQTSPLKAFYKEKGKLYPVQGEGGVEEISKEIMESIKAIQ